MKKIFTLFAATLFAMGLMAECQDGPYGLQINGSRVVEAPKFGDPDAQGRVQYKASCVELQAGDIIKLINLSCDETWMVDIDPYGSYQSFEGGKAAGELTCKTAGSYDFYIKLSMDAGDLVYIGPGENCGGGGGDDPGTNPGDNPDAYWYWKGFVDGKDINNEIDGGIFDCGISEITVEQNGYIFVVYQVKGVPGVQYMAPTYVDGPTHATLTTTGSDKLHIPAGSYTLYLYNNGDGTVELAFEAMSGKKLVDCTDQAIDNTEVVDNARKVIVDGQLRIIHGDKVFDATGRQLQDK